MPWYDYLAGAVGLAIVGNYLYWLFFAKPSPGENEADDYDPPNDDQSGGWP
jgi:hypothetical protein